MRNIAYACASQASPLLRLEAVEHEVARDLAHRSGSLPQGRRAGCATRSRRMRSKCAGSCACVSSPGRGRCRSYRRDSQKRSAAARSSAGHARPLVGRQRPPRVVRRDHRRRRIRRRRRACSAGDAPVVDGDGEVVGKEVGRREAEVDDAGDAAVAKQHVVAEEVAVDRAFGQLAAAEPGLELEFRVEQRDLVGVEVRPSPRAPPAATTRARGGW